MWVLATAMALAAQVAESPSSEWQVIRTNQDATISLDLSSITRNGDRVHARIRAVLAEPYNGIHSNIAELETDCRAQTVRTVAVSVFDRDGRLINRTTYDEPGLSVAGTSDLPMHEAICRLAGLR